MIPSTKGFLQQDFEIVKQPTKTYKMDIESRRIRGNTNGLEAMTQAVYKILLTERYQYIIYSWNYGIETIDLFGMPVTWVCPELKKRISEALLWDSRITAVDNFDLNIEKKGAIHATFTVHTIFGNVEAEKAVNI